MRVLILLLIFSMSPACAGSKEELTESCTSDAMAYCSKVDLLKAAVGKYSGVNACFRKHKAEISETCRATLAKYGIR